MWYVYSRQASASSTVSWAAEWVMGQNKDQGSLWHTICLRSCVSLGIEASQWDRVGLLHVSLWLFSLAIFLLFNLPWEVSSWSGCTTSFCSQVDSAGLRSVISVLGIY